MRGHGVKPGGAVLAKLRTEAFTLLEVMMAMALFFMAVFAILDATSQSLRAARSLRVNFPDASALAADLYVTNRLEEGELSGDFGELYPEFRWRRSIQERETNGLFQVEFVISGQSGGREMVYTNTLLLWRPESNRGLPGLRRGGRQ
jgi:Tfp pilus assembly protein PilV